MTWPLLALLTAGVFLVLAVAHARRTDRRAWPAWEVALAGDDALTYEAAREEIRVRLVGLDQTLLLAQADHAAGLPGAGLILRQATHAALRLVRRLDGWLRVWRDAARALSAVRPVAPLSVRACQSWVLRALALLHHALDAVVTTSRGRFALRVFVLRRGLAWLRRSFGHAAAAARSPRDFRRAAARTETARQDLGTLARDCATTLRSLVVSRAAKR